MKRFAYYIACYTLVVLCACTHDDTDDVISAGNGKITIQASLDDMAITRADVEDTQAERKITHIDVFAVNSDGNIDYYERNTAGNNNGANDEDGSGVLTLNVARRAQSNGEFVFAENEEYKFYLVANATAAKSEMEAIKTLAALQQLVQDDSFIPNTEWESAEQTLLHLTGTTGLGENPDKEAPETFLMDAVATDAQSNNAFVVNSSEGNLTNLNLSAEFKRAAAKIIVNITQGEDVEFRTSMESQTSQYDFIELPASTFVLPSDENLVGIKRVNTNPMGPNDQTFDWASEEPSATNSIQVVGYAYAHFWDNANLKNETSLILNIPMMWNKDDSEDNSKEAAASKSWYKVPLSKDKKFERNKCYVVNVTINAVGAANRSTAIELENIEYKTLDWVGVNINVGDDVNRPAYLELNTDLVEIYNANFDNTSLSFSSSSAITSVTLKDVYKQNADGTFTSATDNYYAYYINKFGIMKSLSETIKAMISATAQPDVLNGNIAILSPIVNTTEAEREKALAALGDEPEEPAVVAPPSGMPEPKLPESTSTSSKGNEWVNSNWREVTTTTTISYSYEGVGENIKFYKTTTVNKTYTRSNGEIRTVNGYPQTTTEEYVNATIKQNYITAYNTWIANNADKVAAYQKYLEKKARYDAYQAALTAIQNSATSGDTHYNTIRYLEFEVENEQGMTATFRVMQYPIIYITNQLCWFSYRDDFGGTTYLNRGTNRYVCATFNNGWGYSDNDGANNHFFASKVADNYDEDTGECTLYYYRWNSNGGVYTDGSSGNTNAHYYHIHVTANSPTYTIGIPRTDTNGYTISSADNEKLVSPSFMIASQLGAVWSGKTGYDRDDAAYHCSQYVEVYRLPAYEEGAKTTTINGQTVYYKELRDWRLPTAAEIQIIVDHQTGVAMDVVLGGGRYYSAGTAQYTSTGQGDDDDTTIYTRCIRDEY